MTPSGRSPRVTSSSSPTPPDDLARLAAASRLLVITDFDGTLAPIVPDPPAATILPAARAALERLIAAGSGADDVPRLVVAVLSGRDAADVARRVRVAGARYLGQHGIEHASLEMDAAGALDPASALDPALAARGRDLQLIANEVRDQLDRPDWLVVEPKGASVGLHYRRAADPDRARLVILATLDAIARGEASSTASAPLVMESRRVVELRPVEAFGKGEATRRLIADIHPDAVLVMGDDRTDAEAFDAVRDWRDASGHPAMIVGVSGASETPPEVRDRSDVLVPGPDAAAELLGRLASDLEARPATGH